MFRKLLLYRNRLSGTVCIVTFRGVYYSSCTPYLVARPVRGRFYLEMQGKPGVPLEQVSVRLSEIASVFVDEALEPERWAMKRVALS